MPRDMHPEIWKVQHELATPDDSVNQSGDCGLHVRLKRWKNEVRKLCDARSDEDEAHEKTSQRNAPEEPQGRERVEHGPDEDEDHQEGVLAPTDVEKTAHGWPKAREIFLDHVDLES